MKLPRRFTLSSSLIVAATTKLYRTNFVSISRQNMSSTCSNDDTVALTPIETTITCSDGIALSAQIWKPELYSSVVNSTTEPTTTARHIRKMLCVHGWMDNCRSYHYFAPNLLKRIQSNRATNPNSTTLIDEDIEIVAIDLPGHGWSSHKSVDAPPVHITDYVYYIAEVVQQLLSSSTGTTTTTTTTNCTDDGDGDTFHTQNEIVLVGHSMGAAICCMYAAAFPERISNLVLLEGAGPMTRPSNEFIKHVRENIVQRQKQQQSPMVKPPRIYPTLHQAITTRMLTVKKFPGQQYISEVAATELVVRGTRAIQEGDTTITATTATTANGTGMIVGYQFRHDPRLQLPSLHYCTVEQVESMYTNIRCPVALLLAQDGWPMSNEKKQQETVVHEYLQPKVFMTLPGSHHFHSDPDTAEAVVETVVNFLSTK